MPAVIKYETVMQVLEEKRDQYKDNMDWAKKTLERKTLFQYTQNVSTLHILVSRANSVGFHVAYLVDYYEKNKFHYESFCRAIEILKHRGTT